ncbi:MAG: hypothetical protein HFH03_05915 [Dorea sp.]|jgi:N-acetylglucosaminyldiphosphoundecaprenol N-acetyl-beta-D-mannosaminyltransferase|nr:hypothetical protein [Dorea sp.]
MSSRINVLDIDIDNFTAKEAMKEFVDSMQSEPISIIEMVTADSLMQMRDVTELKGGIGCFDLVLAGDTTILESADIAEKRCLREIRERTFLKMLLRYISKNHKRVYLLVETEEEGQEFLRFLEYHCRGAQIGGMAKVSAKDRADDMIVNAINGADIDCVISVMSSPLQEDFVMKNKSVLNANVWLGLGKEILPLNKTGVVQSRFTQFVIKKVFQKEMEKRKRVEAQSLQF